MNLDDSIWAAVHECEGGPKSLAPRLAVAFWTLQKMADPKQPGHGWSLDRFRKLLAFTGDRRPLQALCRENGGIFVPLADGPVKSDKELLKALNRLSAEFGDVPRTIHDALARDGRISANELKRIEREGMELIQALTGVVQRVTELHDQHVTLSPEDRA